MPYIRKYYIKNYPIYKSSFIKKQVEPVDPKKPAKKKKHKKKTKKHKKNLLKKYYQQGKKTAKSKGFQKLALRSEEELLATLILNVAPEVSSARPVGGYFRYMMNLF